MEISDLIKKWERISSILEKKRQQLFVLNWQARDEHYSYPIKYISKFLLDLESYNEKMQNDKEYAKCECGGTFIVCEKWKNVKCNKCNKKQNINEKNI